MPRPRPQIDFAALMEPTAIALLGAPNPRLSRPPHELRFGNHGSMAIDLTKGTFYDHENKVGGGVLELIQHTIGGDRLGAVSWLEDQGIVIGRTAPTRPAQEPKIVAEYDYTDEHGTVLFQSVRFGPKAFKQRRPDGNGGWIPNLTGVQRVLYRLPDVIEAVKRGTTVIVTEGEKDADNLRDLGFVATTNPMGANKWESAYNEFLRDADVVIIGDNDGAGRVTSSLLQRILSASPSARVCSISLSIGRNVRTAATFPIGSKPAAMPNN